MSRGKTITIFIPDSQGSSVKVIDVTNSHLKAVVVPRNKLKQAEERLNMVGVYILIGEDDDLGRPQVYVGEGENILHRIKSHDSNKDFWNVVIAFGSAKNDLNKAHVKFLESHCCKMASSLNKCFLHNGNTPQPSNLSESDEDSVLGFFDDLVLVMGTLGYSFLEESKSENNFITYYCSGKLAKAKGKLVDDGFLVFEGSISNLDETTSIGQNISSLRKELIDKKILVEESGVLKFTSDFTFSSPSKAAAVVLARSANGWTEWKDKDGKTMDELERQDG